MVVLLIPEKTSILEDVDSLIETNENAPEVAIGHRNRFQGQIDAGDWENATKKPRNHLSKKEIVFSVQKS